jgi:outer membrane protein insertion porin family
MSIMEQEQIATSIKQLARGNSLDGIVDEALERARMAWQDRGYFKADVSGHGTPFTSNSIGQHLSVSFLVFEGLQYRLGEIAFRNNATISDAKFLRGLFPVRDGDIFSREKIATGLENLSKAYGELGYINFTSVPETRFEDEKGLIFLTVDVDEGRQFHVSNVRVLGLNETARQELIRGLPIGQIYNGRLFEMFLAKNSTIFPFSPQDPRRVHRRLDERTGAVATTLDARPCPTD